MICKIADLQVEIPEVGDMVPRCQAYISKEENGADIIIRTDCFRPDAWQGLSEENYFYMETGTHFHCQLLKYDGMMLHASAVVYNGKAYLFSAPSGTGKSTHTRLWQQVFGEGARVINDDKPALRCVDGQWIAYGTPWCGKDGINLNENAPIGGICFLKRGQANRIRRLDKKEAVAHIVFQTMRRFRLEDNADKMLANVDKLVRSVPIFEMECLPDEEAPKLSYETMSKAAEETEL